MATDYMAPPNAMYHQSSTYHDSAYPGPSHPHSKGSNGRSFAFRKRYEKIDWRRIASIDVDTISRTLDFNALQDNIMNITFCNIEAELDVRMVDPNFIKIFRLAQLSIEYLLHSQEFLTTKLASLEDSIQKAQKEHEETKILLGKQKEELTTVKKESHKRKKLLIAQQQLIHCGSGSYNKCPFCAKAFLNSAFLQSHIVRRHGGATPTPSKDSSSPDQGQVMAPQGPGVNTLLVEEKNELQERVRQMEAQLRHEKKSRKEQKVVQTPQVDLSQEQQTEMEKMKQLFASELRAVQQKYQQAEEMLSHAKGGQGSNLGDLQDDTDNEALRQQHEEVEMLRDQVHSVQQNYQAELMERDKKWQQQMNEMKKQHAEDVRKALEKTKRELATRKARGDNSRLVQQKQEEVEELIKKKKRPPVPKPRVKSPPNYSEEEESEPEESLQGEQTMEQEQIIEEEMRRSAEQQAAAAPQRTQIMSMEPSDDDEESEQTATQSSFMKSARSTARSNATLGTTASGEITLRTTQFLDQLRHNPTLKIMRDELVALLQEQLEKIGIPPGTKGISQDVLANKLTHLKTRRQTLEKKNGHVFIELRDRFDKLATTNAKERLKNLRKSPPVAPGRRPTSGFAQAGSSGSIPTSGFGSSGSPARGPSPRPRPPPAQSPARAPPRSQSPAARSPRRPESPLRKTGSSVDYTSTQWDSDEYESEEEDERVFQARGPVMVTPSRPGAAPPNPFSRSMPQQPSPAPRGQQVKTVVSRPLNTQDDDDDDWNDSESELDLAPNTAPSSLARTPQKPTNVAQLSRSIEMQLAGRKQGTKPAGGVDTMANQRRKIPVGGVEDFDSDSDWDVSPVEDEVPVKSKPKVSAGGPSRHVDASVSSNTYGTSLWGSSSKEPGKGPAPMQRPASGSSFASVSDWSDDDSLDLENI